MSENTKQEFQDLIRTLSTEICKEVLLDDLKKINMDFRDISKNYEEISERFFSEIGGAKTELASFGDAAQALRQYVDILNENTRKVDSALDFIMDENQKSLDGAQERYAGLFKEYESGVRKFTEESRADIFNGFREDLQSAGSQYIDNFRDMLTQQNTEVLIRSLTNLSEQLMDLGGEKERLRRELGEISAAVMRENTAPAENALNLSTEQITQLLGDLILTSGDIQTTLDNFRSTASALDKLAADIQTNSQTVRDALEFVENGNQQLMEQISQDNIRLFEEHTRQLQAMTEQERGSLMGDMRRELEQFSLSYINGLKSMLQKQDISHLPQNLAEINDFFHDIQKDKKAIVQSVEKICENILEKNINRSGQSLTRASVQVLGLSNDMKHSAVKILETLNTFNETTQTVQRQTDAVLDSNTQVRESLDMLREGNERMLADYTAKLELLSETERRELVAAFNQNISEIFLESVTSIQNCLEMDAFEQLSRVIEDSNRQLLRQEKMGVELDDQLLRTQKAMAALDMRNASINIQTQKYMEDFQQAIAGLAQDLGAMHRQDQGSLAALLDSVVKMKEEGKHARKRLTGALIGIGGVLLATWGTVIFLLLRG